MTWLARLTRTAGPAERDQHFRADPLSVLMGPHEANDELRARRPPACADIAPGRGTEGDRR